MVRPNLKGGAWKNSEDEILKAGIMKYGTKKWGSIASLLHKKTPKQCKERWNEWLDPAIKKTEWTREEEEKLLHLAKILPNQWRTIAPMLSRTAYQCIEHFSYLSDLALGKDVSADQNRLRPGDIDPNPEIKPARPDAVDMDDDEREMLQEARARLANTMGRKRKRQAREKILEDARQLAELQKLRELRAAGVEVKGKRMKKWEVDHSKDVVKFHAPVQGSFDVSADRALQQERGDHRLVGKTIRAIEGESRDEREERLRAQDAKRLALRKQVDLPGVIAQVNQRNNAVVVRERAPLVLPAPQLSDEDLAAITRAGALGQLQQQVHLQASGALESRPQGESASGRLMQDARALAAMASAQTPLVGGPATAADAPQVRFRAAAASVATPSVAAGLLGAATPMPGAAGAATGARADPFAMTPMVAGAAPKRPMLPAPRAAGSAVQEQRQRLQAAWARLPQAEGQYELQWPELPAVPAPTLVATATARAAAPAALAANSELASLVSAEEARAEAEAARQRQTQVSQRGLPRPRQTNVAAEQGLAAAAALDASLRARVSSEAAVLVREEALRLLRDDQARMPPPGQPKPAPLAAPVASRALAAAKALVAAEMSKTGPAPPRAPPLDGAMYVSDARDDEQRQADAHAIAAARAAWEQTQEAVQFAPQHKAFIDVRAAPAAAAGVQRQAAQLLVLLRTQQADAATKLSRALAVTQGGYPKRLRAIQQAADKAFAELQRLRGAVALYEAAQAQETAVTAPERLQDARGRVAELRALEATQQEDYLRLRRAVGSEQ